MNCPVCHWPLKPRLQWQTHGYGCAIWRCEGCNCDMAAKAPIESFSSFPENPVQSETTSDSECVSILNALREILSDARPSALKTQLEEVLNDGS